jgi:hypothetical protein
MTDRLTHVIYASVATRPFSTEALVDLLGRAREHNKQVGLTGMLLHAQGNFFQVLEGDGQVIEALYGRIERDPRHTHVTRIIHEPIPRRTFDAWTMGFCDVAPEELAGILGVNDFFREVPSLLDPDAGRARKLLDAFRSGRWRRRLASDARATTAEPSSEGL